MARDCAASTELKRCPSCGHLIARGFNICEHCGHVIPGKENRKQPPRITNVTIKDSVINRSSLVIGDDGAGNEDVRVEDPVVHRSRIGGAAHRQAPLKYGVVPGSRKSVCRRCGREITSRYGLCTHCDVQIA